MSEGERQVTTTLTQDGLAPNLSPRLATWMSWWLPLSRRLHRCQGFVRP